MKKSKHDNNTFEMETLLAISRDCLLPAPLSNAVGTAPLSITQIKHVNGFNQRERVTLESEMTTLLGALIKAQQSYMTLAMAHVDAEQRIWEEFEVAWSKHLLQVTEAIQRPLQRDPFSRARG